MPEEGLPLLPRDHRLTRGEIIRLVTILGRVSVTRIRLTGGEPLLREDILEIVRSLKQVKTVEDLSLTTNGSRLKEWVRPLKEAGLDRINISLDSMNPKRFTEVTRVNACHQVFEAVKAALVAGFPVKVNVVALKGLREEEILEFVHMASDFALEVRFLEFMPLCGTGWRTDLFLPIGQVRDTVEKYFDLVVEDDRRDSPAQTFRILGSCGKVGFIAPLTEPFCDRCSRIRILADGRLRPCLFSTEEFPLRGLLRNGASDEEILEAIREAVKKKPKGNPFYENASRGVSEVRLSSLPRTSMKYIGG